MKHPLSTHQQKAYETLQENIATKRVANTTYRYIVPSRQYYTHQWFWDSCTHAMGLAYVDPQLAVDELESLFASQWENGCIGHINFDPSDTIYYPGPSSWGTQELSPKGTATSGFIQPPLLAISMGHIDIVLSEHKNITEWIGSHLDKLIAYHNFLKRERDPQDCGLITIIHPWESGTDNSPRWDRALRAISMKDIPDYIKQDVDTNRKDRSTGHASHRPQHEDYYRYMYLVDLYKQCHWDTQQILQTTPFAIKDVLVNAIWQKANTCLSEMLSKRHREKEAALFAQYANQTSQALTSLWNSSQQQYGLFDVSKGKKEIFFEETVANFLPIYSQSTTEKQLSSLLKKLEDPQQYAAPYPVPSVSLQSTSFELSRYWRGPSWPITNLFILEGLHAYTDNKTCQQLFKHILQTTIDMIEKGGFYEYYNPFEITTDRQLGFGNFSWSAAIYLYITHKYASYL